MPRLLLAVPPPPHIGAGWLANIRPPGPAGSPPPWQNATSLGLPHEPASRPHRPTEDWGKLLQDVPTASAILDRFLHHALIIPITGQSYRLKDAVTNRQKAKTSTG